MTAVTVNTMRSRLEVRGNRQRGPRDIARRKPFRADRVANVPLGVAFGGADGTIYHARCRRPLEFQGSRGGEELDFYCLQCCEHVTLTVASLAGLPLSEYPAGAP